MVFGMRSAGDPKVREALLKAATAEVASVGRTDEKKYLAALYVEQCRTNDLLEQLVAGRAGVEQR